MTSNINRVFCDNVNYMSRVVKKLNFYICENENADQLPRSWSAPLFSLLPLSSLIQNFKPLAISSGCTVLFVPDWSESTTLVFPRGGSYVIDRGNMENPGPVFITTALKIALDILQINTSNENGFRTDPYSGFSELRGYVRISTVEATVKIRVSSRTEKSIKMRVSTYFFACAKWIHRRSNQFDFLMYNVTKTKWPPSPTHIHDC